MRSMLPHPATARRDKDPHSRFGMSSSFLVPFHISASSSSATSLLSQLRARTRLTNLAVLLLLCLTTLSVLINMRYYLFVPSPGLLGARRYDTSGWEGTSGLQLSSGLPLSLETTIERDPRIQELDHLIMVPGHAIWLGGDAARAEDDDDWVLEPMQRGGSVKTYIRHIEEGVQRAKEDPKSLLIFSGGVTRPPPAPLLSEASSYLSLAYALRSISPSHIPPISDRAPLPVSLRSTTEEFAMDSYENLLFALARFKEVVGSYPAQVTVVGYGMKRRRFEQLHRAAIGWPLERFAYVGIDDTGDTTEHYAGELKYGYHPFLSAPSGCHPPLSTKRMLRNPFSRYHPYHTSCPELSELFEWCPPLITNPPEDRPGAVFEGPSPWSAARPLLGSKAVKAEPGDWGRERW